MKKLYIFLIINYLPIFLYSQKEKYNEFYEAIFNNDKNKANEILIKIQKVEKDDFFYFIKKAELSMDNSAYDSVAIYYEKAIHIRKLSTGYFQKSSTNESIKDVYNNAIVNYDKLIEKRITKNDIDFCNRGIFKMEVGRLDEAIIDFNRSLKIKKHYLTYFNRAICFTNMGNLREAIMDYDSCLFYNSNYSSALVNRGFLYIQIEEFEMAEKDFIKSIQITTNLKDQSYALNNLAFVYYKLGDLENARKNVNLSINLNSLNSYAYKNSALIYFGENDFNLACLELQKALKYGFREKYGDEVDELIQKKCK